MTEPDYTIACERCGAECSGTVALVQHLQDAHAMPTSPAIQERPNATGYKSRCLRSAILSEPCPMRARQHS